ncbi:uncharacterized protein LOC118935326 [Manis pentadactyla]|uniref:uncharacterized protein LOC118935326 n=1 Tax=Manis pentadactyla TaxID=143292 RepID=UPI00255C9FA0|nr:uncharacterized protein LOC118935326 [Manis pentadactyla]
MDLARTPNALQFLRASLTRSPRGSRERCPECSLNEAVRRRSGRGSSPPRAQQAAPGQGREGDALPTSRPLSLLALGVSGSVQPLGVPRLATARTSLPRPHHRSVPPGISYPDSGQTAVQSLCASGKASRPKAAETPRGPRLGSGKILIQAACAAAETRGPHCTLPGWELCPAAFLSQREQRLTICAGLGQVQRMLSGGGEFYPGFERVCK